MKTVHEMAGHFFTTGCNGPGKNWGNPAAFHSTIALLGMTIVVIIFIHFRGIPSIVENRLELLPMKIGGFKGTDDRFPESVDRELNADQYIYRHYDAGGKFIDLYIGYYGTAKGGRTGHNPLACLPGAGWGIVKKGHAMLKVNYPGKGARVNFILARKGERYQALLHWYQADGTRILDTGIKQNFQRFFRKIIFNRNDGAYVQVSGQCIRDDIESTRASLISFAEKLVLVIPRYWPVER